MCYNGIMEIHVSQQPQRNTEKVCQNTISDVQESSIMGGKRSSNIYHQEIRNFRIKNRFVLENFFCAIPFYFLCGYSLSIYAWINFLISVVGVPFSLHCA